MTWFAKLSISSKLRVIITTTCCFVLLTAASIYVASQTASTKRTMARDLLVLTRVVAANSTAAVAFEDQEAAEEVLTALSENADIFAAATYGSNLGILGEYRRAGTPQAIDWPFDPKFGAAAHQFSGSHLDLTVPIVFDTSQIGVIFVRASLASYHAEIRKGMAAIAAITLVVIVVAFLLSSKLERLISRPILRLASTMKRLSREQCFDYRVTKDSDDEVGELIDSFNEMLEEICHRDKNLSEHRKQIEYLAYYDNVTGLPNRAYVTQHLEFALVNAKRNQSAMAVLFIDLDHFKDINDTLGHSAGDDLLRQVGERLKSTVRGSDLVSRLSEDTGVHDMASRRSQNDVIGRIGGDEFVIVLGEISCVEDAAVLAQRIVDTLAQPFDVSGHPRYIGGSIGISVFPDDGGDAESLLKHADAAMYYAKSNGRNGYQFFIESINKRAHERMALEYDLRLGLERNEFVVWYQPRVDIRSREAVSVEALVRWQHPERGLVPPGEFIEMAEGNGLIVPLGLFVLREACRQAKAWHDEGLPRLGVSVNISAAQFKQEHLCADIQQCLDDTGLEAQYLEVELTESMVMNDVEKSIEIITELRSMGVSSSIDDFGTGYSSLHRLKQLPVNALKIDRSFVRDMTSEADTDAIVRAIISLAHSLRLRVIAEGLETQSQLASLFTHDCDEAQGYLFGYPIPADDIPEWLLGWQDSSHYRRQTGQHKALSLAALPTAS